MNRRERQKTKREGEMEESSVFTLGSQVKERRGPASEAIFECFSFAVFVRGGLIQEREIN